MFICNIFLLFALLICGFMQKKAIVILLTMMSVLSVKAQYDVSFAHYYDMQPSFNPASVGKDTKLNACAAYAMDFAGFTNNPKTLYVSADMPLYALKMYHGVGLQFVNDQIGLFTHQRVSALYSAKVNLFGGQLGIGVQLALLMEKFNGSGLDIEDPSDPAFVTSDVKGNKIDFGAGLYYQRGPFYIGASMQHLTSPTVELGEYNEIKVGATYYLTGGYNIKLRNPFITIHPSFMVRTDGVDHREDITCRLAYTHNEKKFSFGVGYAVNKSATIYLGALIKGFNIGYSYEIYTRQIKIGNGSHELMVGYQTEINLHKKGRNLHKSVRFL
ncbi:MAG: type IX secretion system membrane protein PorP/SprF [Bacteroidaceae bacterium]|nr:type IX secretion system membrane protein PorP/SprF [Bacteroidaceae bacterium]